MFYQDMSKMYYTFHIRHMNPSFAIKYVFMRVLTTACTSVYNRVTYEIQYKNMNLTTRIQVKNS